MCELLVRIVDKNHDDLTAHVKMLKRGDVVEVFDDKHDYGTGELSHSFWRILCLPNVPKEVGQSFLGAEISDDPSNPKDNLLQARATKFDLDHDDHGESFKTWLEDDTRVYPMFVLNITEDDILKYQIKKEKVIAPWIIGTNSNQIG